MSENCLRIAFKKQTISYEKFGSGPLVVLLIPDALGTGRTDFLPQLEGEDALNGDKYSLIAVEAPGWGRSRPAPRKYGSEVYNIDCECFDHLMKELGHKMYSIIGWGEGAKTALLMAIKYPANIQCLVLNGISFFNTESALKHMNSMKSVDNWSEERLECYLNVYSIDEMQSLWTKYIRFFGYFNQYFSNDLFKNQYNAVKCPVLLLHGQNDKLTDGRQMQFLKNNIKDSKLHQMANEGHGYHLRNATRFKMFVEEFLSEITDPKAVDEVEDQFVLIPGLL